MDSNLINRVTEIVEIEDDVIDLDGDEKTPEELIYEWDAKIRKKLSMFAVTDNENILGDLMKEYLQSLQEMTRNFEDNGSLKNKVFCHISFLYSYYVELQCCTFDNYLTNMEDILTLYCNLELEVIRPLKRKDLSKREYTRRIVSLCKRIIHVLTVYLLERSDHILHVLIKMNTNNISDSCSEVLNVLYSHFLTKVPVFNSSDESFCRSYIMFQKWKEIRKVEDWEDMDKIMYKILKRTPESIRNNETLRQILMPACQSTVDIVLNLFRSFRDISNAYFKHITAKKNIEMDDLDFNIDLGEDEPTIPIEDEDEEEVEFMKTYFEVERNMSNLSQTSSAVTTEVNVFRECKEELDEDDDVQFVGVTMLPQQRVPEIFIIDDENSHRKSNVNKRYEEERIMISAPISLPTKETDMELENFTSQVSKKRHEEERITNSVSPSLLTKEKNVGLENLTSQISKKRHEEERITNSVRSPSLLTKEKSVGLENVTSQISKKHHEEERIMNLVPPSLLTKEKNVGLENLTSQISKKRHEEERITNSLPPSLLTKEKNMGLDDLTPQVSKKHYEEERIKISAVTSLLTKENNMELENLNGITKTCIGPVSSIVETQNLCSDRQTIESLDPSSTINETNSLNEDCVMEIETNQPKVPLVSNNTQTPSPHSPPKRSDSPENGPKRTIQMKSVEVQADTSNSIKNYLYNDYGLTTPPFDVPTDEHSTRSIEHCVYTNIGQNADNLGESGKNVVTRSVEVQVDPPSGNKNCLYNDYGLTPPNETPIDDHSSRLEENCLYTNIGHHIDLNSSANKTIEQEDFISSEQVILNDLVAQTEVPTILEQCKERLAQIGDVEPQIDGVSYVPEMSSPKAKPCTPPGETQKDDLSRAFTTEHDSELEFEHQLDISEMTNIDADYETEEIDIESCPETDKTIPITRNEGLNNHICEHNETVNCEIKINSESVRHPKDSYDSFQSNDQIDTGQKAILNTAPNIDKDPVKGQNVENALPTKDLAPVPGTFNGNTVLKPLLSSNRTNGQTKESSNSPTKIVYTSTQKIKATSLDDFSKFESAIHIQWSKMKENHDFEEILSGPVTKITPTKHNNLLNSQEKLDIFGQESNSKALAGSNSRSNSPTEMTSPAYEAIDDFRNYFSDSVNGRVPPPHDVRVPQGILKKNNATKKKNFRIMFHESTCDNSEERRPRSDGVLVLKRVRRDRKLNMEPKVVVKRLPVIENKIKKVLNNPPTLRVDYDKTTRHINENDVVRCISPPRFSWVINSYDFPQSRNNPGKVKAKIDDYCKKISSKCEKNKSSCCNQLAEQFTKLNCNVAEENALNLTIPNEPKPIDPESEFSNSPKFLQDSDKLVQQCLQETSIETPNFDIKQNSSFLCDNSNFYKSQTCPNSTDNLSKDDANKSDLVQTNVNSESDVNSNEPIDVDDSLIKLPTAVPETYDFEKNLKNEVFSKIDWQSLEKEDSDCETRLPLKKRKLSVANSNEGEEQKKEEISYPATPMISIAEVEALHLRKLQTNNARPFKTPAERKEMPPLPVFYNVDSDPSPIITDQFNINNHTYNNPTINYHMNNVPVPFINIPCGSYYSLPPILVPFNNVSTFDQNKLNSQQQDQNYVKKENRKQGRQRRRH